MELFKTGGGGCENLHLLRTIYWAVIVTLMYSGDPDKQRILLLARNSASAVHIGATTIHSGLSITCEVQFYPSNDKKKASMWNKLSGVKLLIINRLNLNGYMDTVLSAKFTVNFNIWPFVGLSVVVCGDFYQLSPVKPPKYILSVWFNERLLYKIKSHTQLILFIYLLKTPLQMHKIK